MKVTAKTRLQVRLQNLVFVVLFLGALALLGWLSTRYVYQADWTAGARNTLSASSQKLLATLHGAVRVTAYVSDNDALRERIGELVGRYRRFKPDLELRFVNPEADPASARAEGISMDGELLVAYESRSEKLQDLSEQSLSNALQRLARQQQRWIVFLSGHGERAPKGEANHDLGSFGAELTRKGLTVQTVNLAQTPTIPDNTSVLVLAGPQVDLLPGEVKLVQDYLAKGGNLLWLAEPGALHGLEPLAEQFGVTFLPGVVVDANTQLFGIQNPSFALVADYPDDPITRDFQVFTVFPQAAALQVASPPGWQAHEFLRTLDRAWNETSELSGEIRPDPERDEHVGPLTLGARFTRPAPHAAKGAAPEAGEQRVVILGDGDFLSNTYLGNGGNLNLGLNILNWLTRDDNLIAIPAKTAPDLTLSLSNTAVAVIGLGFLIGLPLALFGGGFAVWMRRRRR